MINIRKATEEDAQTLVRMFTDMFSRKVKSAEIIKDNMIKGKSEYYLAFVDEKPVGAIQIIFKKDDCKLESINTQEKRKGYGSELIKFSENLARERGYKKIWCISNERHKAKGFYEKSNWELEKYVVDYSPGRNVYIFSKKL